MSARGLVLATALALCGCSTPDTVGEYRAVTVVRVDCEHRTGDEDCRTVVQCDSGCTRLILKGTWGMPGDKFCIRKRTVHMHPETFTTWESEP